MGDKENTRTKKINKAKRTRRARRRAALLRRRRMKRRRFFIGIIAIFTLITLILAIGSDKSKAANYEYVTGTCLWTIATQYCPENMDKREYID